MKLLVIDSSVIVKLLNQENEKLIEQASKVLEDAQKGNSILLAPDVSRYEIGNALLVKKLELPKALDSLTVAYKLPVTFVPETEELAHLTYEMAQASNITYYDASFTALAKQTGSTLVTDNPKHQAKVKGVNVLPLKDYK